MKYFLIEQDNNYADEFDVQGFFTQEAESKEELLESLKPKGVSFPAEIYFGTNEEIRFSDMEDYMSSFDIREISENKYDMLDSLFDGEFGDVLLLEDEEEEELA